MQNKRFQWLKWSLAVWLTISQLAVSFSLVQVSAFAESTLTVYYKNPFQGTPNIHYGTGGKWTTVPGNPMTATGSSGWFTHTISNVPGSGTIELTFNDGTNWDSLGGKNYKVDLPVTEVTVQNAQWSKGKPDGVQVGNGGSGTNSGTVNEDQTIVDNSNQSVSDDSITDDLVFEEVVTPKPAVTRKPSVTTRPVTTRKPSALPVAKGKTTPKPTVKPSKTTLAKATAKPKVTAKPKAVPTPRVVKKPVATPTPKPKNEVAFVPVDQTNLKIGKVSKLSLADLLTKAKATAKPTEAPSEEISFDEEVVVEPTARPTVRPTARPTVRPTEVPVEEPVIEPTEAPTPKPTAVPTAKPTVRPTAKPPLASKPGEPLGGDIREDSIYFMMTARWNDGDSSNNRGGQFHEKSGNAKYDDPMWRGDFKGVIDKLDYIKGLGFSAIWITPVVLNRSDYDFHGYHGYDFYRVDARLESPGATYQDLINEAHKRGIKIIQDIVLNHSSRWGAKGLWTTKSYGVRDASWSWYYDELNADFEYDGLSIEPKSGKNYYTGDLWSTAEPQGNTCKNWGVPTQYRSKEGGIIYNCQWPNPTSGMFPKDLFHQCWIGNWEGEDSRSCWIHEDLADFNTENPKVQQFLIDAYKKYIDMGVDGFRLDTAVHIPRTTLNKVFIPALLNYSVEKWGEKGKDFYLVGEVASFVNDKWNRGSVNHSAQFFTWKERKEYSNDLDEASLEMYKWENGQGTDNQPKSDNAFLKGNNYHKPDYSKFSGMHIIDMRMHMNFSEAGNAFYSGMDSDDATNDATFNMVYVDSHDYGPNKSQFRYTGGTDTWAENMSLMWTFRGIPTIYYGSEIEFQAGKQIDCGPTCPLATTGRAYFGDEIAGTIKASDFGVVASADGKVAETMKKPLVRHLQQLNRIRREVPALQKGQYSREGVNGGIAFKKRFTEGSTDSFVLVTVSGDATFSGIPNGTYVDVVTGDKQSVSSGTLTAKCSGKGNLRAYVLELPGNPAPGKISGTSPFLK